MQVCAAELVQVVNTSSHQYFDTATSVCHTKLVACFFQLPTDNAPAALLRLSCVGTMTTSRVLIDKNVHWGRRHKRRSRSSLHCLHRLARRKVPFQVKCVHFACLPPALLRGLPPLNASPSIASLTAPERKAFFGLFGSSTQAATNILILPPASAILSWLRGFFSCLQAMHLQRSCGFSVLVT